MKEFITEDWLKNNISLIMVNQHKHYDLQMNIESKLINDLPDNPLNKSVKDTFDN